MKGYLSDNQIDYILYHLGFIIELPQELSDKLIFTYKEKDTIEQNQSVISIPLTDRGILMENVMYISGIPVLFPMSEKKRFYQVEGLNVYFYHDIFKSAFYLLSGYQETLCTQKDEHGRFPYHLSIQKMLNITGKPIVNYYFEKLAEGIEQFCILNGLAFRRKQLFDSWGLMLTHDVDKLSTYNIYEWIFRMKLLLGLVPSKWNFSQRRSIFFGHLAGMLRPFKRKNLHWNFSALRRIEMQWGMHSVFYFLPKVRKDQHSFYRIDSPLIQEMFQQLIQDGCEVGVHGTYDSAGDAELLSELRERLHKYLGIKPLGIRQHFLRFLLPDTAINQKLAGFEYDTTLGFAEHEGFRNSYCLPFKPYDFEKDQMIDLWEFPLVAMDATLFRYRDLSLQQVISVLDQIVVEVKRFGGLFTFLWHNGPLDDLNYQKTENFYEEILRFFSHKSPQTITGQQMVKKMNSFNSSHQDRNLI